MPEKLRIATVADADWVLADAYRDALRDAGVEADVVVAATGDDKANLLISLLSSRVRRPRVVARLTIRHGSGFSIRRQGVDVSVSTPRIAALVGGCLIGIPVRLFRSNRCCVHAHALILPDSPVVGRRVHSLELPRAPSLARCKWASAHSQRR